MLEAVPHELVTEPVQLVAPAAVTGRVPLPPAAGERVYVPPFAPVQVTDALAPPEVVQETV